MLKPKCFVEVSIISDTKRLAGVQMRINVYKSVDICVCVDTRSHTLAARETVRPSNCTSLFASYKTTSREKSGGFITKTCFYQFCRGLRYSERRLLRRGPKWVDESVRRFEWDAKSCSGGTALFNK